MRKQCEDGGVKRTFQILNEISITAEKDMENIVKDIYDTILNEYSI